MSIEKNFNELCSSSVAKPNFKIIPIDDETMSIRVLKFPLQEAGQSNISPEVLGLRIYFGCVYP